ncbi:hypothetical protein Vretimale_16281 [Volvox reticuliferus]|uniref:Uncharacterized protein n=1 Tax=Volvox reticuliferus TaxID=1737510 RepID=A0A8J4LWJ5_9CHLO|nr:hypothetical protein Vretimale_16281 [Volvox reticuliferus]
MADLVPLSCLSSFPSLDRLMSCRLHDAPTQTFRPSFQSSRGGSGGGGGGGVHGGSHGTITHRSIAAGATRGSNGNRNQAHRPEPRHPQPRFAGNSLPGVGASASAAAASANALRTSFGRIDALRRDGIVPASAGPITPHSNSASHSHFRNHVHAAGGGVQSPGSPTLRALPTAIPSRVATTTPRRRNRAQQPTVRQWHGLEVGYQDYRYTDKRSTGCAVCVPKSCIIAVGYGRWAGAGSYGRWLARKEMCRRRW